MIPYSPCGTRSEVSRLLAEDGAQQALLGVQFRLALRRDLSDEDIAGAHLRADADDTAFVKLAQRVVADVGDIACDLLRPKLCVARFNFVFLDMDRGAR